MDNDLVWNEEPLVPEGLFVKPCVNGISSDPQIFFNFSLLSRCHSAQNCSGLMQQPGASLVAPIMLSLTGITGHVIALAFLYCGTDAAKHKTVFYVLLATLIWTDLVGKVITTPTPILAYVNGHFVGGVHMCNAHGYSMSVIAMLTHFLVAIMAIERYIGIRHGYFYKDYITISRTRILLLSVLIFTMLFCSLPLFGVGEFKLHLPGTWCHINQHICPDQPWQHRTFAYLYTTLNLTSIVILVCCNMAVVGTLLKMRMTTFRPSGQSRPAQTKKGHEREIQMALVLLVITIVYIISWAAHDFLMLTNRIWPPRPFKNPILDIKAIRLVSLNQIIDPWAYIICQVVFKSRIWKLCRGCFLGKMAAMRRDSKNDPYSINSSEMDFRKQSVLTETTLLKDTRALNAIHVCNEKPRFSIAQLRKVCCGAQKSPRKASDVNATQATVNTDQPDIFLDLLPKGEHNSTQDSILLKDSQGNLSVQGIRSKSFGASPKSLPGRSSSWTSPDQFSLSSAYRCHSLYTFQKQDQTPPG